MNASADASVIENVNVTPNKTDSSRDIKAKGQEQAEDVEMKPELTIEGKTREFLRLYREANPGVSDEAFAEISKFCMAMDID